MILVVILVVVVLSDHPPATEHIMLRSWTVSSDGSTYSPLERVRYFILPLSHTGDTDISYVIVVFSLSISFRATVDVDVLRISYASLLRKHIYNLTAIIYAMFCRNTIRP